MIERIGIARLLILVAVLHTPSLFSPFFIDDYIYMDTAEHLGERGLVDLFTTSTMTGTASSVWWTPDGVLPFYRPIAELTMALDYWIWGLHPIGYHLTNLALHVVCTWLAWALGRKLFGGGYDALIVALVFALHPVHSEAVAWISGRFDLLVAACALGSTLMFVRWLTGQGHATINALACLGLFILGLGCKETGLIVPVILVAVAWIRPGTLRDRKVPLMPLVGWGSLFALTGIGYLLGRFAMFGSLGHLPPPYGLDRSTLASAVSGVTWNFAQYLFDFVLMIQVDAIYVSDFWAANPALFGLTLVIALAAAVVCIRWSWRYKAARVGLIWLVAFTAPCLLAMPGERNVYLASAGLAIIAAGAWKRIRERANAAGGMGRAPRRFAGGLVCIFVMLVIVEQGVMWCVAGPGEQLFKDLEAQLPSPPEDARIYIVNLCPLNAVGLNQAVKLRYGRGDLTAYGLTLAPTIEKTSTDLIERVGARTLRIRRENGLFFESFVERFHLFSAPVTELPGAARRAGLELIDPPDSYQELLQLSFRLQISLDDPRVHVFIWNNERIKSPLDLVSVAQLASLERFEPGQWSAVARGAPTNVRYAPAPLP